MYVKKSHQTGTTGSMSFLSPWFFQTPLLDVIEEKFQRSTEIYMLSPMGISLKLHTFFCSRTAANQQQSFVFRYARP